jgi:thiamine biosynthesis lipoprotein
MISVVKNFKTIKYILIAGGLFLAGFLFLKYQYFSFKQYSIDGFTMGTTYSVQIVVPRGKESVDALKIEIDTLLKKINQVFSTYIPTSEISRFNQLDQNQEIEVSESFVQLVLESKRIHDQTFKAFNPTIGPIVRFWGFGANADALNSFNSEKKNRLSQLLEYADLNLVEVNEPNKLKKLKKQVELDLSAIAKGYAIDQISALLNRQFIRNHLVEIGGEIKANGLKRPSEKKMWTVGIEEPNFQGKRKLGVFHQLIDQCMATSGNYRQFKKIDDRFISHILDPRTGLPTENQILSITVVMPKCYEADALATALMVLGKEQSLSLANQYRWPVLIYYQGEDKQLAQEKSVQWNVLFDT